jgi:Protein of unknown function (DUF2510)
MTAIDPASDQPTARGPQAGWYNDPGAPDGTRLRWWNGAGWSEHTQPVAAPPTSPAMASSVPRQGPATAVRGRVMRNGTAWWSFGLGLLALSVALLMLTSHRTSIWISSSGVIAIISGVRALRIRSLGFADALVPAALGIAFGGLGTLLMFVRLLSA